ncbi:unnamed protein product [Allacma fusca]|uniref:Uncharacterized protein n=1 Tax=Allacma fusca TaxID=39272 RepID=A0A8J2KIW9_9HEXA|nr:unnamed protein product [Allacma fusca]
MTEGNTVAEGSEHRHEQLWMTEFGIHWGYCCSYTSDTLLGWRRQCEYFRILILYFIRICKIYRLLLISCTLHGHKMKKALV